MESKKLKPAKQALTDAIHQNGGWLISGDYNFVTSNHRGVVKFFHQKPRRDFVNWVDGSYSLAWFDFHQQLPNWHQTILSRDEYFTAYPEQVKVEVSNETEQKDGVEMKSESEVKIKVGGDWHKNGELPPVGEEVMLNSTNPNDYWAHHVGSKLTIVAHDKDSHGVGIAVYRFIDDGGYNEYHGLVAHAFKPLRTEREKAIDEMVAVANSIGRNSKESNKIISEVAGAIYDAGMYREVK